MEGQNIKSPEGVEKLMKELWLRHTSGQTMLSNNVFIVDLPEPTPEEIKANSGYDIDDDDWYYCAPI